MKLRYTIPCCLTLALVIPLATAHADTVDDLLDQFAKTGAGPFDAAAGEALWNKRFPAGNDQPRACTTCHTADLRQTGKHATTGKPIEPLAPSVNPKRLSDRREIEKWFLRNCKWTLGRECTAQEKGDLLLYLKAQ